MKKSKSAAWYAAMKNKKSGNQYTKAKELGLPPPDNPSKGKPGTFRGKKHSAETRQKISEGMKKAHVEGRAWNLGTNRWINEPSHPEKFFMTVIDNEFDNKNYQYNMYFHGFWLDFAWPELKRCIEIDGKQHLESEQQIQRDKRKEKLLAENGWELLRISWKDMFNDSKTHIKVCKKFIDTEPLT